MPPEHARRVNLGGGMVRPTVLVDGEVVGTWSGGGRAREVNVEPFRPLTEEESAAISREIDDVARFLTPTS